MGIKKKDEVDHKDEVKDKRKNEKKDKVAVEKEGDKSEPVTTAPPSTEDNEEGTTDSTSSSE